jgi:hypothetical protein
MLTRIDEDDYGMRRDQDLRRGCVRAMKERVKVELVKVEFVEERESRVRVEKEGNGGGNGGNLYVS